MKVFRLFALFGIVLLVALVLLQPTLSRALYVQSAGGGAAATATPAISVPTAVATVGNVFTTMTGASSTTHDYELCYLVQNTAVQTWVVGSAGTNAPQWSVLDGTITAVQAGVWAAFIGHCVQPQEPATFTFNQLSNTIATRQACLLIRNTGCAPDTSALSTQTNSSTINYGQMKTTLANDLLVYAGAWTGGAGTSMSTNPSGLTVGVTTTSDADYGAQIGYIPQATATTVAATSGTLSASVNNLGGVVAIVPIH